MSDLFGFLFFLAFWAVVFIAILCFLAFRSYNRLQSLAQSIKERASNVQISMSRKLSLINQLIDIVKSFQEGEQFTHLKIAQDTGTSGLMSAYQQSGSVLTTLQGVAERFPELKASEQYHRLVDSIQDCESDIQESRKSYNGAVKDYNNVCLAIPTVFVAKFMGFNSAPYLEFDVSGAQDVTSLKGFHTDDGERLQQLLTRAGSSITDATRSLTHQAGQGGRLIFDKIKDRTTPKYFYTIPGGVPKGPVSINEIKRMLSEGALDGQAMIAQSSTENWTSVQSLAEADAEAKPETSADSPNEGRERAY